MKTATTTTTSHLRLLTQCLTRSMHGKWTSQKTSYCGVKKTSIQLIAHYGAQARLIGLHPITRYTAKKNTYKNIKESNLFKWKSYLFLRKHLHTWYKQIYRCIKLFRRPMINIMVTGTYLILLHTLFQEYIFSLIIFYA